MKSFEQAVLRVEVRTQERLHLLVAPPESGLCGRGEALQSLGEGGDVEVDGYLVYVVHRADDVLNAMSLGVEE